MPSADPGWLKTAALLCVSASAGWAMLGDLGGQIWLMWLVGLLCLCGYGLGAWLVSRGGSSLVVILGCAAVMRLLLLPADPSLSDDVYRYLWDGRMQWAGLNPYSHAPSDPAIAHLRDRDWERINHPDVPTVYPPAAQWFFAAVVGWGGGVTLLKFGLILCDSITLWALVALLRRRGRDPGWVLLYAWHPLPVLEIAGSGHIDALGVAALMASLVWLERGRRISAALGFAIAILAKLIPVVCAVAFWRFWQRPGKWAWIDPFPRAPLLLTGGIVIASYGWFFLDGGMGIFSGLQTYALKWRFNDGLFALLYHVLRDPDLSWDDAALLQARQISLALWVGVLGVAVRWRDPVRISFTLLGAYVVCSPTVHPWYLLWVLPFLPLFPRPAWLVWSWSILLSYEVLIGYHAAGIWEPAAWAPWIQYVPFFVLLAAGPWWPRRDAHATMERLAASDV